MDSSDACVLNFRSTLNWHNSQAHDSTREEDRTTALTQRMRMFGGNFPASSSLRFMFLIFFRLFSLARVCSILPEKESVSFLLKVGRSSSCRKRQNCYRKLSYAQSVELQKILLNVISLRSNYAHSFSPIRLTLHFTLCRVAK